MDTIYVHIFNKAKDVWKLKWFFCDWKPQSLACEVS